MAYRYWGKLKVNPSRYCPKYLGSLYFVNVAVGLNRYCRFKRVWGRRLGKFLTFQSFSYNLETYRQFEIWTAPERAFPVICWRLSKIPGYGDCEALHSRCCQRQKSIRNRGLLEKGENWARAYLIKGPKRFRNFACGLYYGAVWPTDAPWYF